MTSTELDRTVLALPSLPLFTGANAHGLFRMFNKELSKRGLSAVLSRPPGDRPGMIAVFHPHGRSLHRINWAAGGLVTLGGGVYGRHAPGLGAALVRASQEAERQGEEPHWRGGLYPACPQLCEEGKPILILLRTWGEGYWRTWACLSGEQVTLMVNRTVVTGTLRDRSPEQEDSVWRVDVDEGTPEHIRAELWRWGAIGICWPRPAWHEDHQWGQLQKERARKGSGAEGGEFQEQDRDESFTGLPVPGLPAPPKGTRTLTA